MTDDWKRIRVDVHLPDGTIERGILGYHEDGPFITLENGENIINQNDVFIGQWKMVIRLAGKAEWF